MTNIAEVPRTAAERGRIAPIRLAHVLLRIAKEPGVTPATPNSTGNDWFARSDFDTNPIGVKFDPDDIIRRYRSGEDPAELFARPKIAPSQTICQEMPK